MRRRRSGAHSTATRIQFWDLCFKQRCPSPTSSSYPGCRAAIGEAYSRRGTPKSAIQIMLNSLSNNTLKQYDTSFKQWWLFCKQNKIDFYQASIPFVLKFLTERFENGASYGTINSTRSALSLLIGPRIGNDDRIKRFVKGVFRLKPPTPKYNITWDPSIVLNYLKGLYPNEVISLEQLTHKVVMLLALTTGHRVQTLSLIKINNIQFTHEGVQIFIPDLIKTSGKNSKQPLLNLKIFSNKIEVCPVTTLNSYIKRTQSIRDTNSLLITHKKPHHAVSTQTISRWIKNVLKEAGIDVNIFTAHSTRHASTSAASRSGISIDIIQKTAGWSENSICFAKHYNRPISSEPDQFCSTICNLISD
ncbi:uncharacterized protein LOC125231019 isoform X1 [Leguminivora glycinivorella]|uniref:uncharacterized protein LOC125231019 isoform X1 n=1 Tax=Leguminivora glycinivorella TaxID=1035111 RepID=UPI00200CAAB0|nr:uncharacterized protein LOC125231019 isoform X1 [Leguminivora glycinivorella]